MNGRGFILCVSGPSGSGKTSLCDRLAAEHRFASRSISVTTRPQRPGERSGLDYIFVSPEEFEAMKSSNGLLEWAEVFGNWYGTPRRPVEEALSANKVMVMDIDTIGARNIKKQFASQCVTVFVLPPSLDELEKRLRARKQNTPEDLARRLKEAEREMAEAPEYDFQIRNDDLERAYNQLKEIVVKARESS